MISKKEEQLKHDDILDIEEELLQKHEKKMKKHYLKSDAKAFIHKFVKMFK